MFAGTGFTPGSCTTAGFLNRWYRRALASSRSRGNGSGSTTIFTSSCSEERAKNLHPFVCCRTRSAVPRRSCGEFSTLCIRSRTQGCLFCRITPSRLIASGACSRHPCRLAHATRRSIFLRTPSRYIARQDRCVQRGDILLRPSRGNLLRRSVQAHHAGQPFGCLGQSEPRSGGLARCREGCIGQARLFHVSAREIIPGGCNPRWLLTLRRSCLRVVRHKRTRYSRMACSDKKMRRGGGGIFG